VRLLRSVVQAREEATRLSTRRPKLVLKISPDLDSRGVGDIAEAVSTVKGIDGVIVTNTTIQRPAHLRSGACLTSHHPFFCHHSCRLHLANRAEQGGLSGAPLQPLALNAIRELRKRLPAEVPIIGCGGVSSGADALAFARAGASCIQLYTVFGYDGAGACRRIKDELTEELRRSGTTWWTVVAQAVKENAATSPESVGVRQLVRQAEGLKVLLDELAERMSRDLSASA
jgi:dihydroorotate dehydrogenase